MKRAAIIAAMLLLGAVRAGAQSRWNEDTTCLRLYFADQDHIGYDSLYNPDSVMMDTCVKPFNNLDVWIHRGIRMVLPIKLPWAPSDSIVEVSWTSIDTDTFYYPYRQAFQKIYDSIGPYVLRELYPSDTNALWFEFRFFSYTPADSVYSYLYEIPGLNALAAYPTVPGGASVAQSADMHEENLKVYPSPARGFVHVNVPTSGKEFVFTILDELGRVMNDVPIRWESKNIYTLDFSSNFSPGLYFVRWGPYCTRIVLKNDW